MKKKLKKIKSKLGMIRKIRETIINGQEIIKLVKDREVLKKKILCSEFGLDNGIEIHSESSATAPEEIQIKKKRKFKYF